MRKIVLGVGISLDGYIARPDDSLDFLFMPKDYSMAPFFATVDTAIMGRKTLEVGLKNGGAGALSTLKAYVMSRTMRQGKHDGWTVTRQSPKDLVAEIRQNRGKDIWLTGGGVVAREFLKADLVDEIHLGVVPVLIGEGIPLFPAGFPQREFKLIENRTYSHGLIAVKYGRVRTSTGRSKRKA
jgi:dihydrofolate reductase